MPLLVDPVVVEGRLRAVPQPTLRADTLVVRPWTVDDVPALVVAYSDPAIRRWHARSLDEVEATEWVAFQAERWAGEIGADWAVQGAEGVVGRLGLRTINLAEGRAEVSYWVMPAARGQGVAGRALAAVTAWAFDEVGLNRLELVHSIHNGPSCRVAMKAGFALEGTKRQAELHADGWHDVHLHAVVNVLVDSP